MGPSADDLELAIERAVKYLRDAQSEDGFWCGTVEMGVTTTLQDFLQREFLTLMTPDVSKATANYIKRWQNDDGGFPKYQSGPSELSPSIEAYLALRLAGDDLRDSHMRAAAERIRSLGGLELAPGFPTRFWLAAFGLLSWSTVHPVPPHLLYLPRWVPGNILDYAAWVRQMLASFSIFTVIKPVHPVSFDVDELRTGVAQAEPRDLKHLAERAVLLWNDSRWNPSLHRAMRRSTQWLIEHQDAAGHWCGGFSYAPMSLCVAGLDANHPVVERALGAIDRLAVWRDDERYMQPLNSHVGDTSLVVPALIAAGVAVDDPAILRAVEWLLQVEVRSEGDWAGKRPGVSAGAWPFEIGNNWYPDNDDTSWVVRALNMACGDTNGRVSAAVQRGLGWLSAMQSANGGWGAFDVDNDSKLASRLYDNAGPVIDPPTADVTAHVLLTMAELGMGDSETVERGLEFLWSVQEPEGPWSGRWFVNYVFGTSQVALALGSLGFQDDPRLIRSLAWLKSVQNDDGGWGERFDSYRDRSLMGIGASTPSQTAWAVQALSVLDPDCPEVRAGADWLVRCQRHDGSWSEPEFTGASLTPFYDIRYSLMAEVIFPLTALADYRRFRPSGR